MEKWWHRARHRMGDIGMTQEQLAERFDMTTGGMQKWLAGKREPSLDRINEIAAVLGVPGSYLTHGVTPDDLATDLPEPARAIVRRLITGARSGALDATWFARCGAVLEMLMPGQVETQRFAGTPPAAHERVGAADLTRYVVVTGVEDERMQPTLGLLQRYAEDLIVRESTQDWARYVDAMHRAARPAGLLS